MRRLTRGGGPSWSPDGRRIAFTRIPAIYVINADGTGERRIVPLPGRPASERNEDPAWSPAH